MAGRRRKRLKQLVEAIKEDKKYLTEKKNEPKEQETWSDLPRELLELILSQLTLKDNILASAVCKKWFSVATSVRPAKRPPLLMYFPRKGDRYEFYDPSLRKSICLVLPELSGCQFCYSKDGWLLLYRPINFHLFFFNPFTRESIKLPNYELPYQMIFAFSSAPTSPGCTVFSVDHVNNTHIAVITCSPGAAEWTRVTYYSDPSFVGSMQNKMVFCNGIFYCLCLTGILGLFDPVNRVWKVLNVRPANCPQNFLGTHRWKNTFLAAYQGDIFVTYTCSDAEPVIFKLNQEEKVWKEVKTLGGVTMFASFLTSYVKSDLLGTMRNSVYFPKVRYFGRRCISYSLDTHRYHPKNELHDFSEQEPYKIIWIEQPGDLSIFR